jgi:hypothetical protein
LWNDLREPVSVGRKVTVGDDVDGVEHVVSYSPGKERLSLGQACLQGGGILAGDDITGRFNLSEELGVGTL